MKKILLIEPPFYRLFKDSYSLDRYPLSLGYLSAVIARDTDWNVSAYNADFADSYESFSIPYIKGEGFSHFQKMLKDTDKPVWGEIRRTLGEFSPDIVGITAKTQNFKSATVVAGLVKEILPDTPVIVGGPHASMVRGEVLECENIDVCVIGEGEETILELLEVYEEKKSLEDVKGIIFRKNSDLYHTPPREMIQDLDSLPFPYEYASKVLKDFHKYPDSAFRYIFTTRGCPYNCFFCGSRNIWTRKVRFRSVKNIIEEIKLIKPLGKRISFEDDTFGINRKNIRELCEALSEDFNDLEWNCEIHVKLVNDENLTVMKKAGCIAIMLGVESGNNDMLEKISKGFKIDEAHAAADLIKKYGIELSAFFMVGFPWETLETLNDTYIAMKKMNCDHLTYSIFTPYPGTDAFKFCLENNLVEKGMDFSKYNHLSPANCFCINLTHRELTENVLKIEKLVARRNLTDGIKYLLKTGIISRLKKHGIKNSFLKIVKLIKAGLYIK